MKTRTCAWCGNQYMSEAETEITMPFCSKGCRYWYNNEEEWDYLHDDQVCEEIR